MSCLDFAYISDLESWSAFVWSIISVLLCQHSFGDVWSCFSICSMRLCMCFFFFHCIIIEHTLECLVWWHSMSYVGYYLTLGHNPILRFIRMFADFSHYSIYFLIFASHHTGAYPPLAIFLSGHAPLSLGLPCLVLSSWLSDPFVDLYGLSPRAFPYCHLI